MANVLTGLLNPTRVLFDLQQSNEIAQSLAGCFDPEAIAHRVTQGLVEKFDCAFARLWLLEPDRSSLKLVASSGLYTRTDGAFARVPMGAYKVGKIAQNRVSFLSNNLAAEPWVGNREWAIAHQIRGFAGYPLAIKNNVIGVLAIFSHQALEPEFLEVLQTLCTLVTIALEAAIYYQKEKQSIASSSIVHLPLSDQIASILSSTRLALVGTEQNLSLSATYLFLQTAEILHKTSCTYCRLIYTETTVAIKAIVPTATDAVEPALGVLSALVAGAGGVLQTQADMKGQSQSGTPRSLQVVMSIPIDPPALGIPLRIVCRRSLLQSAFTQLAISAGLTVCSRNDPAIPLLTDDVLQIPTADRIIWIQHNSEVPQGIQAKIDLSIRSDELRQAVEAVNQDESWGIDRPPETQLSDRERTILTLLTQGCRDREIADRLIISESTVKFHMNNVLSKLKARTRYQAIHLAIVNGWIQ